MTEKEWLDKDGFSDHEGSGTALLCVGIIAAAFTVMKHFSNSARESRGEKKETWVEWFLR